MMIISNFFQSYLQEMKEKEFVSRQRKGMDIFLRTGKSRRQQISEFQNASNTLKASENLLGISPAGKIQLMPPCEA